MREIINRQRRSRFENRRNISLCSAAAFLRHSRPKTLTAERLRRTTNVLRPGYPPGLAELPCVAYLCVWARGLHCVPPRRLHRHFSNATMMRRGPRLNSSSFCTDYRREQRARWHHSRHNHAKEFDFERAASQALNELTHADEPKGVQDVNWIQAAQFSVVSGRPAL